MNKRIRILSTVLLASIMLTIGFTGRELLKVEPVMANTETNKMNIITARGEGIIKVKPDLAYITMGVRTESKDANLAQTDNAKKMSELLAALKGMNIDEKDIQTSNYSMYPQYNWEAKGPERITGYTVENTVKITVRDISKIGDVLDLGVEKGANISHGIQFSVSDMEKSYQEALKQAIYNAKGKAEAMGEAIGVTIKNPSSVIEQSTGGGSIMYAADNLMKERAEATSTPVEAGELDIRASVEVNYRY